MKRKLQVFISSTYRDLGPERQAAVSAILKAGHIPAGMELFTAGDKSQMATITQWIDESDVYMLILGGRYGSIEPKTGTSYTEIEYDYAVSQGKPFFAVVITEAALEQKVRTLGSDYLERDNNKELRAFREKVLSNISSFFDDAKDIKLCVHETLSEFSSNRDLKGWVSADEIQDTKPLYDDLKRLSDENNALKDSIDALKKEIEKSSLKAAPKQNQEFDDLRRVLHEIEIKVPANLNKGVETNTTLLDLFYANKDLLMNGVTNAQNATDVQQFFFYTICPKLQIHGLVVNEKVAGAIYRRCTLSNLGRQFLAVIEKQLILSKANAKTKPPR